MTYLVDTNIVLRYALVAHPMNTQITASVKELHRRGDDLRALAQNLIEMWNALTRPTAQNGFGLSVTEAERHVVRVEQIFPVLPDTPDIFSQWKRLVVQYQVLGAKVHDARLVAAMLTHGVSRILTLNTTDFGRFAPEGIVAVDPLTI